MKFFKKLKKAIVSGKIIKDYGVVNEQLKGIARVKHRVLLVEKYGKKRIVIREGSTLIGKEPRDFEFSRQGAQRLRDSLGDALRRIQ